MFITHSFVVVFEREQQIDFEVESTSVHFNLFLLFVFFCEEMDPSQPINPEPQRIENVPLLQETTLDEPVYKTLVKTENTLELSFHSIKFSPLF